MTAPLDFIARAAELDATDPLAAHRSAFVDPEGLVAYLDGNSLGRPLRRTQQRLAEFVSGAWGSRLIRSWGESWMELPTVLGDRLGAATLGAAAGQSFIGDSTTVLLYKLARAAVDARPGRREIVLDSGNFPTDRFVLEGIAAERGLELRWIHPDPNAGVTAEEVAEVTGPNTALVLLSHVAYRSGHLADMAAITAAAHEAGALILWDLCHSVGAVDLELDALGVDLAVGCTYKYLNGGPGAPAVAYVAARLQDELRQPIQGWMGASDPFAMAERYEAADGIRRFISGTPPILGMLPLADTVELIEEAGMAAIRAKSIALTEFAIAYADAELLPRGAVLSSPRDAAARGGHITLDHPAFETLVPLLWSEGVIPDFRPPSGLRIGLSPLSTSFAELERGLAAIAAGLDAH